LLYKSDRDTCRARTRHHGLHLTPPTKTRTKKKTKEKKKKRTKERKKKRKESEKPCTREDLSVCPGVFLRQIAFPSLASLPAPFLPQADKSSARRLWSASTCVQARRRISLAAYRESVHLGRSRRRVDAEVDQGEKSAHLFFFGDSLFFSIVLYACVRRLVFSPHAEFLFWTLQSEADGVQPSEETHLVQLLVLRSLRKIRGRREQYFVSSLDTKVQPVSTLHSLRFTCLKRNGASPEAETVFLGRSTKTKRKTARDRTGDRLFSRILHLVRLLSSLVVNVLRFPRSILRPRLLSRSRGEHPSAVLSHMAETTKVFFPLY
ncbi:hypothetical protein TGDOM2_400810, partial [Toxoplasma gondii GAB2-2007-GAL-DOM2]